MGKGANLTAVMDLALIALRRVDGHIITHGAVHEHGVGADLAVFANDGFAAPTGTGEEQSAESDYIDNILNSYTIDDYTFYCYLTNSDFE